jgi:hypothetical protein
MTRLNVRRRDIAKGLKRKIVKLWGESDFYRRWKQRRAQRMGTRTLGSEAGLPEENLGRD